LWLLREMGQDCPRHTTAVCSGHFCALERDWAFVTSASLLADARNSCRVGPLCGFSNPTQLLTRHVLTRGWSLAFGMPVDGYTQDPMAEVVQGTPQEFWRPPSPLRVDDTPGLTSISTMAQACGRCGSEFLAGSHFCHTCGSRRHFELSDSTKADALALAQIWEQTVDGFQRVVSAGRKINLPSWLRYLHFHEIKHQIGLSSGSLISFVIGLACVAGALLVGLLTAKTFVDWQAIQFYRSEWLLAATAAFVAGILLKKPSSEQDDED